MAMVVKIEITDQEIMVIEITTTEIEPKILYP
jgi:hypothetical protein